jgi:hypothetical protein
MSEHAPGNHESPEAPAGLEKLEILAKHAVKHEKHVSKAEKEDPRQLAEKARQDIGETSRSNTGRNALEQLETADNTPQLATPRTINRELKRITLQRELQAIRRKLPARERAFSKVVHQPVVRTISEVAGKSVSRPSGLLGGGLVAFLGTSGYLYMARHSGFTYNYLIFLVLFIGGFLVGLGLELLVYMATASRRRSHD